MPAFLFELELPEMDADMLNTIPAQREMISAFLADGKIVSYSVSQSRNMIWCVVDAESEQDATEIVLQFPLYPFFTDIVCHPLLFHSTVPMALPGLSLN
jgi:hypothetical protein